MTREQVDALIEFIRREIACAKDGPDGWVEEQRKKAEANLRALLTDKAVTGLQNILGPLSLPPAGDDHG